MQKTTFRISKMDCPSEEQMIRMKLEGQSGIWSMQFDIPGRTLLILHSGSHEAISSQIQSLGLGATLIETTETDNDKEHDTKDADQKILWQVLIINFSFFILELLTGFLSGSMGLVADGLDMLADSVIYGLALYAVGGSMLRKKKIASAAGYLQFILAFLGLAEVIRRIVIPVHEPAFQTMIIVSLLALTGNVACLYLLQKSSSREAHMQASMIFTSNDVIANLGVIAAGVLVYLTGSKYPDLVVGLLVFILVGRGAFRILKLSK